MRPSDGARDHVSCPPRSSHLSNKTINVVELGKAEDMKISRAWVFHDDMFILLSHEKLLYMSVEVDMTT